MTYPNALRTFNSPSGIKAHIVSDEDPINPRTEWDNVTKIVCFHGRYDLGDTPKTLGWTPRRENFLGWSELESHIEKEEDGFMILPLYLYDHSGLALSTKPFNCRWDSGQVGFIYVTNAAAKEAWPDLTGEALQERALAALVADAKVYGAYVAGDVYGYVVEDKDNNHLDSCFGYFDLIDCEEEAKRSLEHYAAERTAALTDRLHAVNLARAYLERNASEIPVTTLTTLTKAVDAYSKL